MQHTISTILCSLFLLATFPKVAQANILLNVEFWKYAAVADVEAEIERGEDIVARDEYGATPLHWAAAWSSTEIVKLMLEHGADITSRDRYGSTPLFRAAGNNGSAVLNLLIEHGANINARNKEGSTPLHMAARIGSPAVVEFLLNHGAHGAAQDKWGSTPFDYAQGKLSASSFYGFLKGKYNKKLKDTTAYWLLNEAQYR
ncbi:MAG: ankyrin repeat domain-containing protein [Parvularculales bacterium]